MRVPRAFTLIELLIVVAVITVLAGIAIPNVLNAQRRSRYARAAADTKIAVSETILYANDRGVYPNDLTGVRNAGYASVADLDPWRRPYGLGVNLVSPPVPVQPSKSDNVWACSHGAATGAGGPMRLNCPEALTGAPPLPVGGSVGYSSVYGSWSSS